MSTDRYSPNLACTRMNLISFCQRILRNISFTSMTKELRGERHNSHTDSVSRYAFYAKRIRPGQLKRQLLHSDTRLKYRSAHLTVQRSFSYNIGLSSSKQTWLRRFKIGYCRVPPIRFKFYVIELVAQQSNILRTSTHGTWLARTCGRSECRSLFNPVIVLFFCCYLHSQEVRQTTHFRLTFPFLPTD